MDTQVFFNLGELDDALNYALHAGSLFDVSEKSEYVQTILGREGLITRCTVCYHLCLGINAGCGPTVLL